MKIRKNKLAAACLVWLFLAGTVLAQTTAFNYQGKLTESGNPANGNFQMQFRLFDSLGGAGQVGSTLSDVPVTVTNGVFSVKLDFGANALSGANRWLEIAVRRNSGESYVTLAPREQIASTPYAVRTLSAASADNALNLGGIAASEYVTTSNVGSSFIRNGTTLQTGNFNISGSGFVGGNLGIGTTNPFSTLDVRGNLLLDPGLSPILYTSVAGSEQNRYLNLINSPSFSSASGLKAGGILVADSYNFANPGKNDLIVKGNVGIGLATPLSPLSVQTDNLNYGFTHTNGDVTFGSYVDASRGWFGTRSNHPLSFFTNNGSAAMTIDTNGNVNIGGGDQVVGNTKFEVVSSRLIGIIGRSSSVLGGIGVFGTADGGNSPTGVWGTVTNGVGVKGSSENGSGIYGESTSGYAGVFNGRLYASNNVGIGVLQPARLLHVNGRARIGVIPLEASSAAVCFNAQGDILQCGASSLIWKTDISPFNSGLEVVLRLQPINFRWKESGVFDFGLGAEEVEKVAPELTFKDEKGEVKGVKYDRLSIVFVNAFKEQQQQIERQSVIIKRQQQQIDALFKLICQQNPNSEICREEK